MDDQLLVEAARRGNDRAFAVLVRAHERALYCTAYSILGSSWDASDAVQDAFLEAYARIDTLRDAAQVQALAGAHPRQRLLRRARAAAAASSPSARRRRRGRAGGDGRAAARRTRSSARRRSSTCSAPCAPSTRTSRTVIALRYFVDLKVDDIAAVLDVPAGTVKSRINRALARLAASLGRSTPLEVKQ